MPSIHRFHPIKVSVGIHNFGAAKDHESVSEGAPPRTIPLSPTTTAICEIRSIIFYNHETRFFFFYLTTHISPRLSPRRSWLARPRSHLSTFRPWPSSLTAASRYCYGHNHTNTDIQDEVGRKGACKRFSQVFPFLQQRRRLREALAHGIGYIYWTQEQTKAGQYLQRCWTTRTCWPTRQLPRTCG